MATSGDRYPATSGDFFMATHIPGGQDSGAVSILFGITPGPRAGGRANAVLAMASEVGPILAIGQA